MKRQLGRLRRGFYLACLLELGSLFAPLPVVAVTHLADWDAFDSLMEIAVATRPDVIYPPFESTFTHTIGLQTFDPDGLPNLTNTPPAKCVGNIPVWMLHTVETNGWFLTASGGMAIHSNAVVAYDAESWARAKYGNPPHWIAADPSLLEEWYFLRRRERVEMSLYLVPEPQWDDYRAVLFAAAAGKPPPGVPVPTPPADTNRVAFARVAPSSAGTFDFDLYTPGDLPVDVFAKTNLSGGPLWNYAGTVQAVAPFTPSAVAAPHATLFLHAALGRLVAATNAANEQVFANRYDPVGNLTNRTDGADNTVLYVYDELNRLVSRSAQSAQSADEFSYDAVGNLLTASNETAYLLFAYDAMDRLTTSVSCVSVSPVSSFEFPVSYARDLGGLVTNLVYASGKTLTRTYDPDGRLASVSDWLGHTWTFAWDGTGKPTGGTAPGGIVATNHYDAAGRLSTWSVGSLAGRTITRDAAGLKTRDDITAGPHPAPTVVRYAENTFDAADRLVSAQVRYGSHTNTAISETYRYDGNGALTNLFSASNAVFSAAYDPLGQLSSLQSGAGVPPAVFGYDALGNRVVADGKLWLPDHADPLKRPLIEAEAATGEPIRYYLWAPGRLLGFIDAASGTLTVAHCDEYGSVVALTDASGSVLHTACYGPNGQDWGTTGTNPTPFGWLGGHGVQRVAVSDHLGPLYLTRYRLYAASLNRFLSTDPLGLAGGLNLYAYAEGDPLSYIDPLGLCGESVWGAAASGFLEGLGGGLSVLANAFTFGGTDALGWTDSASYEGSQYTVSRVTATVARESLITAGTLGIGTAARGGSAAAQAAYKGILVAGAATGGYQIGTGAQQISEGNYEAGALNVVAGGLRVGGSIVSAGAIAKSQGNWTYGDHKSTQKFQNQMQKRGWTPQQIDEAMASGNRVSAPNQVNPGNTAIRYVHPTTGRSVVVDDVTHEVLHVGGDGFRY